MFDSRISTPTGIVPSLLESLSKGSIFKWAPLSISFSSFYFRADADMLQTTNENWIPTIHRDVVKIFHKLVLLDNLAVYWNSDSQLFSDLNDKKEIRRKLQETIHNGKNNPEGYKYSEFCIHLDLAVKKALGNF